MTYCDAGAALAYYTSGKLWQDISLPHDLIWPHDGLLRRTVDALDLLPSSSIRSLASGRFLAHVTPRNWPLRNECLQDFSNRAEALAAISASCCFSPGGVEYRGDYYLDGASFHVLLIVPSADIFSDSSC